MQGDLDGLHYSLLVSSESLCHFHQTDPFSLCAQECQQMFSGWLISGSPTRCLVWGRQCKKIYLAFSAGQHGTFGTFTSLHRLLMLSFFAEFPFFLCLNCSFSLQRMRLWSVQHSTLGITLVRKTFFWSLWHKST